jgi:hypothetical protein
MVTLPGRGRSSARLHMSSAAPFKVRGMFLNVGFHLLCLMIDLAPSTVWYSEGLLVFLNSPRCHFTTSWLSPNILTFSLKLGCPWSSSSVNLIRA